MTLQLKITLKHSENPSIWRRISVPDTLNFYQLHLVIQGAFSWQLAHLYRFGQDERDYPGIGIVFEDPMPGEGKALSADTVLIRDFLTKEKQTFVYVYDFGDNWVHEIEVEEILSSKTRVPKCLAGKGFAPPEDCGGIPGFYMMLEALEDATHPEHESYREWLGMQDDEYLDRNHFSKADANKLIREYLKNYGDKNMYG